MAAQPRRAAESAPPPAADRSDLPLNSPLAFFELTTVSGEVIVTPLAYPEMVWLNSSAATMARRMAQAVQAQLIDKGRYLEAVRLATPGPLERREIDVDLPAGPDPLLQPARRLRHVAFLTTGEPDAAGVAIVPALGVVALAATRALPAALAEAVVQEHRRTGRVADVRRQVSAGWHEQVALKQLPLDIMFHGAEALRRLQEERSEPLLETVAEPMNPGPRGATGLGDVLATLKRAAEGSFARSVLVVGAEGSGKTALIHEYVRDRRRRAGVPFETTAARLIQGLTRDGGWQHPLTLLCRELAERDLILCVGHLAELFEVGQYQGNSVSLGDALREPLARGRLMLIAEATPAELARIELRSPGFAALFQTVRMPEWPEQAQERLMLDAVAALAGEHRVSVAPEAVAELIALQRRFSPYSGFPGKGIRFFEELILHARDRSPSLGRSEALDAFCAETGMPRLMLDARLPLDLAEVDGLFRRRLFGQPDALAVVSGLLASTKMGLARSGKPIASLLLIGPTGVGKTETAKALAEFMFGDPRRMIRFDMSEYADPAAVLRLLGDLGHAEGVLIGAVRRQPFSVLLFDELEKAHASFFDLLLQVLGEGRLTGGDGLTANFCGCIVVMTSNLGAELMQRTPMGINARRDDPRRHFEQVVQAAFRPELFNRIDHVVPFSALSAVDRAPIFEREIGLMRRREGLLERAAELAIGDDVPGQLAALPGDPRYGARDVQRVLRQRVLLPLAHALAPHAYVTPLAVRVAAASPHDGTALTVRSEPLQQPVDLAPLQAAEAMAETRRHWQRITDGPLFVNLANQVFRLDDERRRHDEKRLHQPQLPHWDNTEAAALFRELTTVQQTAHGLFDEITALEGDALLALVGEAAASPDPTAWRERFAALKRRAFHAVRPASASCSIGLYAAPQIATMLHAAFSAQAVRAGFAIKAQVVRIGEAATPDTYRKTPWPPKPMAAKTPATKPATARETPLVGYELELRGATVFDRFRNESGLWRVWEGDRKSDAWVAVRNVALDGFRTPKDVHRQHFFDALAVHRQLKGGQLSDPRADWRCDFPDEAAWQRLLDQRFEALIDRMLLGEED